MHHEDSAGPDLAAGVRVPDAHLRHLPVGDALLRPHADDHREGAPGLLQHEQLLPAALGWGLPSLHEDCLPAVVLHPLPAHGRAHLEPGTGHGPGRAPGPRRGHLLRVRLLGRLHLHHGRLALDGLDVRDLAPVHRARGGQEPALARARAAAPGPRERAGRDAVGHGRQGDPRLRLHRALLPGPRAGRGPGHRAAREVAALASLPERQVLWDPGAARRRLPRRRAGARRAAGEPAQHLPRGLPGGPAAAGRPLDPGQALLREVRQDEGRQQAAGDGAPVLQPQQATEAPLQQVPGARALHARRHF
mmetsp:Transcript_70857/g.200773  ORF Transcript_70857/g.200773 Transcript_70857/m.200773 type:complete len:305 (+) Transcript_70857:86-1000(+)